ncbi:MAG: trypsin-like serine protease, partial [Kofleriaceae bacterium]
DTVIAGLDNGADTIYVGDATYHTCVGDSGGPVLKDNVVLGVDSYSATGCTDPAHFRRTDVYAAFIDQYAGTVPPDSGSGSGSGAGSGSGSGSGSGHDDDGGGCAAGHGAGLAVSLALASLMVRRRRFA